MCPPPEFDCVAGFNRRLTRARLNGPDGSGQKMMSPGSPENLRPIQGGVIPPGRSFLRAAQQRKAEKPHILFPFWLGPWLRGGHQSENLRDSPVVIEDTRC